MLFWVIPVPLWVMLALYVVYDLHPVLLSLAGHRFNDGVAHAGHLGGLAFGLLYWRLGLRLEAVFGRKWKGTRVKPYRPARPAARAARLAEGDPEGIIPFPKADPLRERVDELLKKISEQGKESLTAEEREALMKASEKLRGER
jgi:hypothetical protein